jgi:sugar phosphate permease
LLATNYLRQATDVVTGRRRIFYGWWLLAACVVSMTVVSGLAAWSFGLYVKPLEEEFGWSRAEVSLGFSAAILTSGAAGPLIGIWIDRRGARAVMLVGCVLTAITYMLLATTSSLWQWYLYCAINAAFRQMIFFIPMQVLVSRWFDKRRGVALSILGTGFSLGGFLLLPLVALTIDLTDWRGGFVFSGVVAAAVVMPIALFVLRNRPEDAGTTPDGEPSQGTGTAGGSAAGLTLAEAMRQPLFWVLSPALMLYFFGAIGWTVHIVPFYESRGLSTETAALLLSVASGAGIFARLIIGVYADRFARFETPAAAMTGLLVVGMAALLLDEGWFGIGVFSVCWIVGTSAGSMAESMTLTRAFGMAHFATILGAVVVIETAGEVLSPSLAGAIFDDTGSYDLALLMYIGTFTGSTALMAVASRMRRPVLEISGPLSSAPVSA